MADMLATVAELRDRLGQPALDTDEASRALVSATALVQAATRQRLIAVTADTVKLQAPHGHRLTLPEQPVTTVGAVATTTWWSATPIPLNPSAYTVAGPVITNRFGWSRYDTVVVTYDHGYAVIPEDLKTVVLSVASRFIANPDGMRSETIGAYSYTLAGDAEGVGGGLTKADQTVCDRYRQQTYAMRS